MKEKIKSVSMKSKEEMAAMAANNGVISAKRKRKYQQSAAAIENGVKRRIENERMKKKMWQWRKRANENEMAKINENGKTK
jgi:hypothetical protein